MRRFTGTVRRITVQEITVDVEADDWVEADEAAESEAEALAHWPNGTYEYVIDLEEI